MGSKLWVPLLLILALSIATLMALGIKLARNERRVLAYQYGELYQARLKDYRAVVQSMIKNRMNKLSTLLAESDASEAALRNIVEQNSLATHAFVLERSGALTLPNANDSSISVEERQFLDRTRSIWSDGSLQTTAYASEEEGGWFPYFWKDGLHLLYYVKHGDKLVGVEISKARLYSHIIGLLPDDRYFGPNFPDRLVVLLDEKQNSIYKWGAISVEKMRDPVVTVNLLPPLDGLKFSYFVPAELWDKPFYSSALFTILPAVLLVISILVMLAVYFYREHTREIREASQRVNFVNQVSHELKTPLTNIRMYAELLENRLDDDDVKSVNHLSVIVSESQRLSRLITTILTFSLKEKDKLELHLTPARVPDVIEEVLEQFRPGLAEKGIEIKTRYQDNSIVQVDTDFLQQILGNLISNVKKYAADGKLLAVEYSRDDRYSYVKVYDHGPGIPRESREQIFEAFYRSSNELTDGISGTGIGLSISRDLARLHRGELRVIDSQRGACFLVSLQTSSNATGGQTEKSTSKGE